jgi:hypothetical protein
MTPAERVDAIASRFPSAPEPERPCANLTDCASENCDRVTCLCCEGARECKKCERTYCRSHRYLLCATGCEACAEEVF